MLDKIKNDWRVTLNAFQLDMAKALTACEIIKSRHPYLYQENKFITHTVTLESRESGEEAEKEGAEKELKTKVRSGISITLS